LVSASDLFTAWFRLAGKGIVVELAAVMQVRSIEAVDAQSNIVLGKAP
jgi:hypothetical protein